jgi:hypothetical protein
MYNQTGILQEDQLRKREIREGFSMLPSKWMGEHFVVANPHVCPISNPVIARSMGGHRGPPLHFQYIAITGKL